MNLVDSSAWLEYFADGPNAKHFARPIEDTGKLLVSSINLFEVFRRIHQQRGEAQALLAVSAMQQGTVVDVTGAVALSAARLSLEERLAMADALLYATARGYGATLWTQDADFEGRSGVRYFAKG